MAITRLMILLFAPACISLCSAQDNIQKTNATVVLHDEKISFTPHEFYVTDVTDERSDRSSVASLIDDKDMAYKPVSVDLKGGAGSAIKNFIYRNLHRDTTLRPVIVTIKEFKLTETSLPGKRVSGHLTIAFSFD